MTTDGHRDSNQAMSGEPRFIKDWRTVVAVAFGAVIGFIFTLGLLAAGETTLAYFTGVLFVLNASGFIVWVRLNVDRRQA